MNWDSEPQNRGKATSQLAAVVPGMHPRMDAMHMQEIDLFAKRAQGMLLGHVALRESRPSEICARTRVTRVQLPYAQRSPSLLPCLNDSLL